MTNQIYIIVYKITDDYENPKGSDHQLPYEKVHYNAWYDTWTNPVDIYPDSAGSFDLFSPKIDDNEPVWPNAIAPVKFQIGTIVGPRDGIQVNMDPITYDLSGSVTKPGEYTIPIIVTYSDGHQTTISVQIKAQRSNYGKASDDECGYDDDGYYYPCNPIPIVQENPWPILPTPVMPPVPMNPPTSVTPPTPTTPPTPVTSPTPTTPPTPTPVTAPKYNGNQLPQTGSSGSNGVSVVGMLFVSLLSLFGLSGINRKHGNRR